MKVKQSNLPGEISSVAGGISRSEIEILVSAMQDAPGFSGATIKEYENYNQAGRIISLRIKGRLVGIAAYKDFGDNWVEFTTLLILPEFRGLGLGRELWRKVLYGLSAKNIFVISANPLIKRNLALADGFDRRKFWQLPGVVQRYMILQKMSWSKVKGLMSKQSAPMREFDFFVKLV